MTKQEKKIIKALLNALDKADWSFGREPAGIEDIVEARAEIKLKLKI